MTQGPKIAPNKLDSIGELIIVIGYFVVIGGTVLGLGGLISVDDYDGLGVTGIVTGLGLIVTGIITIGQGYLLKVIGKIELNTQRTSLLLSKMGGLTSDGSGIRSDREKKPSSDDGHPIKQRVEIRSKQGMASNEFIFWLRRLRKECPEFEKSSDSYLYNTLFKVGKDPFKN